MLLQVSISREALNEAFYALRRAELHWEVALNPDLFYCPACTHSPLAVHVDGNLKLFRYSYVGRYHFQY